MSTPPSSRHPGNVTLKAAMQTIAEKMTIKGDLFILYIRLSYN
jgi:hypothetical protein